MLDLYNLFPAISRSCSQAPAFAPQTCLGHTINVLRSKICLCNQDLCNGPSNVTGREQFEFFPPPDNMAMKIDINAYSIVLSLSCSLMFLNSI